MEETLKQLEPADKLLSCRELLQRWDKVPQHTLLKAVEGGLLIPLRYSGGPGVPTLETAKLPTQADDPNYPSVNLELAEDFGVMFSRANVLLLEDRFPNVFPGRMRKQKYSEPMDVIMRLVEEKELAQMEVAAMRTEFQDLLEKYLAEVDRLNQCMRYIDSLKAWVKDLRKATRAGGNIQICDGQGLSRWLCDRRRAGVSDAETVQFLHHTLKHAQSASAFMVKGPTEFAEELDMAEKGAPISNEARRGLYTSIVTGKNKARKKKQPEDQKDFSGEDADEDFF